MTDSSLSLKTGQLLNTIRKEISRADGIFMLSSFLMESGVRLIEKDLQKAALRGAEIKILTGDYLYITDPAAIKRLTLLTPAPEVRLYRTCQKTSFHPKAYLFYSKEHGSCFLIGSANLSASALAGGIEWNLRVSGVDFPQTFDKALIRFHELFYHEDTLELNRETVKFYQNEYLSYRTKHQDDHWIQTLTEAEEAQLMFPEEKAGGVEEAVMLQETRQKYSALTPRQAQKEALASLDQTFSEGYDRSLVVMATGLGKTYLAGFFAKQFKRILFVAHREEILKQSLTTFQRIMPDRSFGFYYSKEKNKTADCVFASIYTLGLKHHLENFSQEAFDLIVIDEFHHAAAKSYRRLIEYFRPRFLLGLTATPDRMDGKDVYALCDGNVAYSIDFLQAVEKGWLCPFKYYGVYDETDYSKLTWLGHRYDEQELLAAQLREDYAKNVLRSWEKYRQTRSLGFCSSIKQAEFLAHYFNENGYRAYALHSRSPDSRAEIIEKLVRGRLDIIFTVDLFNEGVDIPEVDTVLFVRPTESLSVFIQQVGRGLRLADGKSCCHIIDLIGNYRNADLKFGLFDRRSEKERKKSEILPELPNDCQIYIEDLRVIDLLKEMKTKRQPRKERLVAAYQEVKYKLGRRPSYLELHLYGTVSAKAFRQAPFHSLFAFLAEAGELTDLEQEVVNKYHSWFVEAEKTPMSKSYKMIVLKYMLERGEENWLNPVRPEEVAPYFYKYLTEKEYRKKIDFSDGESKALWNYDQKKVAKLIARMPMTKWSNSSAGYVTFTKNVFRINIDPEKRLQRIVYEWTRQICEYRLHEHFEKKSNKK